MEAALVSTFPKIWGELKVHFRVVTAILLRDMRTRFGRTHLAYLVAIGWPLSHLLGVVITFVIVNRFIPFGNDSVVFISTGALPYILCLYPARMMATMMMHTGATLSFSIVHPVDLIIARAILETLSAFTVVLVFTFGLWALDVDVLPNDIPTALCAMYAAVFFGVSAGAFTMVLRALFKTAGFLVLVISMIGLYISSGVYAPARPSSEIMRTLVGLNPIYNLVQWMRSAYFETQITVPVDKTYVLLLSAFLLMLGLLGERLFRGKFLTS
jgi:capsular polysaccharide transport system permease protein